MEQEALLDLFLQEAQEQQAEIEQLLTAFEQNPTQYASVEAMFRYMHTLKANAFALELKGIGELAHLLEDIFNAILKKNLVLDAAWFSELLRANDKLGELLQAVKTQEKINYKGLLTKLKVKFNQSQQQDTILNIKQDTAPTTPPQTEIAQAEIEEEAVAKYPENQTSKKQTQTTNPQPSRNIQFNDTVQIQVQKLDDLLNLAGELGIERDRLLTIAPQKKQLDKKDFNHLQRLTSELQHSVIQVRLVKVEILFQKFHRVVREVALAENKKVLLHLAGTHIEIDRNILQVISDSLVHLVRNAIGHGLESEAERLQKGKIAEGNVSLRAYNEKEKVIIEVKDDGRGINEQAIRQKLIEKKWFSEGELKRMSREEIFQQLFEPSFSSASTITEISGRGVGLDVVKNAVDAVGGKIFIISEEEKGTTFQMHLPVSMMLKAVLFFMVDTQTYGIPLMYIEGVCALARQEVYTVGASTLIHYQNQHLPLIDLKSYFYPDESIPTPTKTHTEHTEEVGIVVADSTRKICLRVTRLLHQKEIIEKQLPPLLQTVSTFSGATILGNGQVCLVLDVLNILRNSRQNTAKP